MDSVNYILCSKTTNICSCPSEYLLIKVIQMSILHVIYIVGSVFLWIISKWSIWCMSVQDSLSQWLESWFSWIVICDPEFSWFRLRNYIPKKSLFSREIFLPLGYICLCHHVAHIPILLKHDKEIERKFSEDLRNKKSIIYVFHKDRQKEKV